MNNNIGDPMLAWKARGRELNELYDALTEVVRQPAPGLDPVADLKALGAERDELVVEVERLRRMLRELHAAGVELAPLVGYVNARVGVRWDDAMGAAASVLDEEGSA